MIKETFARRFKELEIQFKALPLRHSEHSSGRNYAAAVWKQWGTSAQSLIRAVFGENSPHYLNYTTVFNRCGGGDYEVNTLNGIFLSAKQDFEGGYVFDVDLRVSGEVFGDFVVLARTAISEGQKDVAAVLACAALEDALKRFAAIKGLNVDDKTMSEVINALKGAGLVSGAQKSLLDIMPKIRNLAMHGNWAKISEPDVSSVIGFVEQFLLSNFAP